MGVTELLTIVFIILRLTGTIDWSWWLVLLPELIALGFYFIFVIVYLVTIIATLFQTFKGGK